MQAESATKIEGNVDQAASLLLAMASGYAAWVALAMRVPLLERGAGAIAFAGVMGLMSFRLLRAIEPDSREHPVAIFHVTDIEDVRAIEPELLRLPAPVVELGQIDPEQSGLPAPIFEINAIESQPSEELLLTDRYEPAEEPLVLEDILDQLEPDSRVVRLFDPAAMPTPGQLNDRIELHLVRGAPPAPSQDASQALQDALAELRRSLR